MSLQREEQRLPRRTARRSGNASYFPAMESTKDHRAGKDSISIHSVQGSRYWERKTADAPRERATRRPGVNDAVLSSRTQPHPMPPIASYGRSFSYPQWSVPRAYGVCISSFSARNKGGAYHSARSGLTSMQAGSRMARQLQAIARSSPKSKRNKAHRRRQRRRSDPTPGRPELSLAAFVRSKRGKAHRRRQRRRSDPTPRQASRSNAASRRLWRKPGYDITLPSDMDLPSTIIRSFSVR